MKVLYITTIGGTMTFFKSFIKELVATGNVVDIAANETTSPVPDFYRELGCQIYHTDSSRSPFSSGNIKAIKQIRELVEKNDYDIVHCHTPLAAASTRLACKRLRKNGRVKVVYTAHGFHFYKGAPLKNWLIFYPIEKLCSHYTDVLITINKEDYALAQRKMEARKVEYVPGVGIDVSKFSNTVVDRRQKRAEIGVPEDAFMLLSVGELNENKNHKVIIEAIAKLNNSNIHYVIAGVGNQKENLQKLADKLGVKLHLLGYRSDIAELDKTTDCFVLPSIREGLNVSIMEAMASGLPVLCGRIRGNVDLIDNENCLFEPMNVDEVKNAIEYGFLNQEKLSNQNSQKIKEFELTKVNELMSKIYGTICQEK